MADYGSFVARRARQQGEEGQQAEGSRRGESSVWGRALVSGVTVAALCFATLTLSAQLKVTTTEESVATDAVNVRVRSAAGPQAQEEEGVLETPMYQLRTQNRYGEQPQSVLGGYYPYAMVLEPHRTTQISVVLGADRSPLAAAAAEKQTESQAAATDVSVTWTVDGEEVEVMDDGSIEVTCTELRTHVVRATVVATDAQDKTVVEAEAKCIYVRRAFTSLDQEDQETFLSAMEEVYRLTPEEGRDKYGEDFKTISYFLNMHLDGAGLECDGWHDNAGVFPHHSAFNMVFERNLQRVDPSIALAHWDYFLDGDEFAGNQMQDIPSLQPFGEFSDTAENGALTSGHFQALPVPTAEDDSAEQNPYGLLRAPWNTDGEAYLKRYPNFLTVHPESYELPGCFQMLACYEKSSFGSFSSCAAEGFHGPVHAAIAGEKARTPAFQANVDRLLEYGSLESSGALKNVLAAAIAGHSLHFKRFWRHGFSRCPTSCDADTTSDYSACMCSVSEAMRENLGVRALLQETEMDKVLEAAGVDVTAEDVDMGLLNAVVDVFGTNTLVGDMFTSAAPMDPVFWLIHSPMERMYQMILHEVDNGMREFDTSWGYELLHAVTEDSTVCDWSDVDLTDETALPVCTTGLCTGHAEGDTLPMTGFLEDGDTYTNADYLLLVHPSNTDRPYIFEQIDVESQCGVTSSSTSASSSQD